MFSYRMPFDFMVKPFIVFIGYLQLSVHKRWLHERGFVKELKIHGFVFLGTFVTNLQFIENGCIKPLGIIHGFIELIWRSRKMVHKKC